MMERKRLVFSFADIEVRESEFNIVRNGEVLAVEPKAFRVLLFLLRNPHKLITKEELLDAVWGDVAVSENSLTRSIALLRKLLGDDTHESRFIATVPTVGYRFLCDVRTAEDGVVEMKGVENGPPTIEEARQAKAGEHELQPFISRSKYRVLISAGVGLVVVIALLIGFLVHRAISNRSSVSAHTSISKTTNSRMRVTQLTSLPGDYRDPAFSPNGEQIAYIWDGENLVRGDLYVQLVGVDERPQRLSRTKSGFVCCVSWSPDGHEIAFGLCDDNGGGVYIVPALGGTERKVTDVLCLYGRIGDPQWTADGLSLVLADGCVPNSRLGIVVFSLQTGKRRCLDTPPPGDVGDGAPLLSPDRQKVAFTRQPTPGFTQLYTVSLSGTDLRQLTFGDESTCVLRWSADGKYVVFGSCYGQMYRIPATGGDIERETTVFPYDGALSRDGRRLARVEPGEPATSSSAVRRVQVSSPGGRVDSQTQILAATAANTGVQLSPDEQQIAFESDRSGGPRIWKSNAAGSDPLQMTFFDEGWPGTPRWSPDGKWIAFDYHDHHSQIYMIDLEGRNQHAITAGDYENCVPSWSRDGMAIYFASNRTGDWQVWKRELSTGQESQMTRHGGFAAFESYDGRTLYYSRFEGGGIWSMPAGGGEEQRITDALHLGYWGHFAVTDNGIYFLDSDEEPGPTIMYYNFETRRSTPVFTLKLNPVPWTANVSASRDGRTLFYAQKEFRNSYITMVENFQ